MAKKTKTKIPKTIGGVKVPKELRKAGNKVIKLAHEPVINDIVAAGLLAAAAALTADKKLGDAARAIGEEAEEAGAAGARTAQRAKVIAGAAATAMGKALLEELTSGRIVGKLAATPRRSRAR